MESKNIIWIFICEVGPEIESINRRVESQTGGEAILECKIKGNPIKNYYWTKDGALVGNLIIKNENTISGGDDFASSSSSSSSHHRHHSHHLKGPKYDIESYLNRHSDQEHSLVLKLTIKVNLIFVFFLISFHFSFS